MDRDGQKLADLTRRGQGDPKRTKMARKGPKGPGNHRNGQTVATKRQQITETAGKRPNQPGNHQETEKNAPDYTNIFLS